MTNCPFCDRGISVTNKNLSINCSCSNCGKFTLASIMDTHVNGNIKNFFQVNDKLEIYRKRHLIAGWLYEFNRGKDKPYVFNSIDDFDAILNDAHMPKTPMQRLERFLLNLYKVSDKFGEPITVNGTNSIAYARD